MSTHVFNGRDRWIARVAPQLVGAAIVALLLAPTQLAAQDTTKHTMPGMSGMSGMKMPASPKKTATKSAKPRSSTTGAPTATTTPKAKPKAKVPAKTMHATQPAAATTKPNAGGMGAMPMAMPAKHDSAHAGMSAMPAMDHKAMMDTSHAAMPGMTRKAGTDSASHDMQHMDMPSHTGHSATKAEMAAMPGMAGMAAADTGTMQGMAGMQMIDGPLGIPMERTGSGTSWLPDDSPMHADHLMAGNWEIMLHGVAFVMYDKQGSKRGDEQFASVNWGMLMATREAGGGRLQLRGMLSAEPWTVGGKGYPLLLQSGETFQGEALHDRQHPHDLFMELAGLYEHAISSRLGASLYLAPVGEPAMGPVAFPHRPSAMNDPMAPISHHWQDATHISFGVLTAGIFTHSLRLEGSVFNGREPDENRTNFDYAGRSLDSYAGRLAWNPSPHWSLSGSYGYLKSPEALKPLESVHRINASIMNGRTFGQHGELATTFVYGANRHSGSTRLEPSYLLESNLEVGGAHSIFGRAEFVQKGAEDLALAPGVSGEFNITSLAAGYVFEFDRVGAVRTGIGARASVDVIPSGLQPYYGTRTPSGLSIYIRFRPQRMSEGHDMRMGAPASGAHAGH
ncbi:MAG: hypothetical protein M3Z05_13975 [Gemmatimonadota bacterium]|nr:hypothetical protein [Gemmatimonadota bacterium]